MGENHKRSIGNICQRIVNSTPNYKSARDDHTPDQICKLAFQYLSSKVKGSDFAMADLESKIRTHDARPHLEHLGDEIRKAGTTWPHEEFLKKKQSIAFDLGIVALCNDSTMLQDYHRAVSKIEDDHVRYEFNNSFFNYLFSGGDPLNLAKIARLATFSAKQDFDLGPLSQLRSNKVYDLDWSFPSWSYMIDFLLKLDPADDKSLSTYARQMLNVAEARRESYKMGLKTGVNCGDITDLDYNLMVKYLKVSPYAFSALVSGSLDFFRQRQFKESSLDEYSRFFESALGQMEMQQRSDILYASAEIADRHGISQHEFLDKLCSAVAEDPSLQDHFNKRYAMYQSLKSTATLRNAEIPDPLTILKRLKLDILHRGSDYIEAQIRAANLVSKPFVNKVAHSVIQASLEQGLYDHIPLDVIIDFANQQSNNYDTYTARSEDNKPVVDVYRNQLTAASKIGVRPLMDFLNKSYTLFIGKSHRTLRSLNPRGEFRNMQDAMYAVTHHVLDSTIEACIDGDMLDLIENDKVFPYYEKMLSVKGGWSAQELISITSNFLKRAAKLKMESTAGDKQFNDWHGRIMKSRSKKELLDLLIAPAADSQGADIAAKLGDNSDLFRKIASIYAMQPMQLSQIDESVLEMKYPLVMPGVVFLPKQIQVLESKAANNELYTYLLYLQAGLIRYSLFPASKSPVPEQMQALLNELKSYANPEIAFNIYSILNYKRSRDHIAAVHPGLRKRFEDAEMKLRESLPTVPSYYPIEEMLKTMRCRYLLSMNIDSKTAGYLAKSIDPIVNTIESMAENEFLSAVKTVYEILDKRFKFPASKTDDLMKSFGSELEKIKKADRRIHISYMNQEVHYFPEDGQKTRVIVKKAGTLQNDTVEKIRAEDHGRILRYIHEIESIKPQRVRYERRLLEGDLDEELAREFLIDLRSGVVPEMDIYKKRRVKERDLAMLFTVNQSKYLASVTDGKPLLDQVKRAIICANEVFRSNDDPYAIYGYSSRGRDNVIVNEYKGFDAPADIETDYRLGMFPGTNRSRTGAAYKYFTGLLGSREEHTKLHIDVVVKLADDDEYSGQTGIDDTKSAVRQEMAKGIRLYALCLDDVPTDVLADIYGHGNFMQVSEPERLPDQVFRIYKTLAFQT